MKVLGFAAYWSLAILQFFGIYSFFSHVLDWNGFFAFIFSLLLCGIPIVGTVFGILGVVNGWGWGVIPALCLYFWPYIIVFLVMIFTRNQSNI